MSKYKKIFSGLGLLSISTLIGAGVVACAKNPSPKDSSTEAIDQNNNQGNSTTPEQGKPKICHRILHQEQIIIIKKNLRFQKKGLLLQKHLKQKHPKIQKCLKKTLNKMIILVKTMVQTIMHKKKINQLLHRNQNLNQKLQLKQNQWN
ncbi:hypothetical protein NWP96_00065 [Mycoplasmopsis cynos]|nr:hypothetical protein [Mycoplasmopsis cynos]